MRSAAVITLGAALAAGPVQALSLADCKRTTHPSHGGEIFHQDVGEGRVMWLDWWSQEGTAKTIVLVECASGETLSLLTAEENMGRRSAFDRTEDARDIIDRHHAGARAFATFERMAADLEPIARDVEIAVATNETCACAAAYPQMGGDKTEFVLSDAG